MAVAFVIGNSTRFTASLLEPGTTIAALIANDFGEATETYRSALLLLGFVLFIVTFIVLAIARLMLGHLSHKEGNCWAPSRTMPPCAPPTHFTVGARSPTPCSWCSRAW